MGTNKNAIQLQGPYQRIEKDAGDTIKPGMLVAGNSDDELIPHGTEGGVAERLFAVEDTLQGDDITDSYSSGDKVQANSQVKGNRVQAWLKAGADYDINTILISAGDGTLIAESAAGSDTTVVDRIAVLKEATDLSDSDAVNTLAAVAVL